jgi:hypothetical protein
MSSNPMFCITGSDGDDRVTIGSSPENPRPTARMYEDSANEIITSYLLWCVEEFCNLNRLREEVSPFCQV